MTTNRGSFRGSFSFVWDMSKALGQGATSVVYMGRNKKTGDEVAVKVFNAQSHHRPLNVQNREFDVMKMLNHENIVKLIAVEEEVPSGNNVIIMEYCTHGTLYSLLETPENNHGLLEEEFLQVLQQVSAGVKHLRDNDVIHRDIKPGNILRSVMPDGRSVYKLTDFGAARELQQDEEFFSLYGTDEYLHPDMYERAVLRRSKGQHFGLYVDLWSLGVTFFHVATGSLPFRPHGGRRNRETMHMITTKKDHGVISGVQFKDGGPVEWSRDLPPTCRLSRGMKSLITPLLAALLEKDQSKTISFDEFFAQVNDITTRTPYHMFCPLFFSMMTVYARPQDDISQIRQLITAQTLIPGGAQLLLHDGKVLSSEGREPMSRQLSSDTKGNPIFVFNKLPEYKGFRRPSVGVFMDIPIATCIDSDYPLSKKCMAVLYSMRSAVKHLKTCTEHLHTAVKMYSDYVNGKCTEVEISLLFTSKASSDAAMFKEQLFKLVAVEGTLLRCLPQTEENSMLATGVNMLQTLQQTGHRECSQHFSQIQTRLDKVMSMMRSVKSGQNQETAWDRKTGCVPTDRCVEKMDVLVSRLHKILSSFKEDRMKRNLNNNEEQIHRVDKNKMKELTITAKTLLEDHCTGRSQALFSAFKQFYSKKVQINDAVDKLTCDLQDINDQQNRLVEKLKVSSEECSSQANSCLIGLEKSNAVVNGGVNKGQGDHCQFSRDSRKEKLNSFLSSIQDTSADILAVKELVDENTKMISKFQENNSGSEVDDWEMINNSLPSDNLVHPDSK